MKEVTNEELKTIQIDILDEVHAYCVQNDIPYSLSFGTLLGAVRHSGYIPWDDDIDIMIPRKYYESFIHNYQGKFSKVISLETNGDYYLPFAKVYDTRTLVVENVTCQPCFGVNIDVFPVDAMPELQDEINAHVSHKWRWNKILVIKNGRFNSLPFAKRMAMYAYQTLLRLFSRKFVLKKLDMYSRAYENIACPKAGIVAPADNRTKWIVSKDIFESYTELPFEGKNYSVVEQYDTYLTAIYGDYMKLPPVEQRVTHHGFVAYWKD